MPLEKVGDTMWTYNYNYNYNNELYHFGIKGMKWGVRRYQNADGSLTSAGRKRYSNDSPYGVKVKKKVSINKPDNSNQNQEEAKTKKGLTDKQKKALKIGAAVAGTALAAYGSYKLYQLYTGSNQKVDPETGFRLINKNLTDKQQLDAINPGRIRFLNKQGSFKNKEIIQGSSQNCMLCTTAYELRQRGYDVHAGYSEAGLSMNDLFSKIYGKDWASKADGGTIKLLDYPDARQKILEANGDRSKLQDLIPTLLQDKINEGIAAQGPNTRGNIMVFWAGQEGGHSMIWETKNGITKFLDGQTGQEYKNFKDDILKYVNPNKATTILRTDNLDIDFKEVKNFMNSDTILKTYVDHGAEIAASMAEEPAVQQAAIVATSGAIAGVSGYASYKQKSKERIKQYDK